MSTFRKATKAQKRLRLCLYGVSGSGKTYSALALARGLGGKVAVIDTESGSASAYANIFDFDSLDMHPPYTPGAYVSAIRAAETEGYDIVVIDSLTHAWSGQGGALEMVDNAAKRNAGGNTYTAWRDVTPEHNKLIDAIVGSRCHVIATMRSKTEYVLEVNERGKAVPKRRGMAPIQRDGMEYEFDVVAEMTIDNEMVIQKTRCPELSGQVISKPGEATSSILHAWLMDDALPQQPSATPPAPSQSASRGEQAVTINRAADWLAVNPRVNADNVGELRHHVAATGWVKPEGVAKDANDVRALFADWVAGRLAGRQ